jgi:hypothetical protein
MTKTSILTFSLYCLFNLTGLDGFAQISRPDSIRLEAYTDTINALSDEMFTNPDERLRMQANHQIIRTLKNALLIENSFQYGFPELTSISVVQPEDGRFRIFTWQFTFNNNTYRYFGAIQKNNPQLELYPLVDYSVLMDKTERITTDNDHWIGALYYDVVKVSDGKQDYYTVFGYDGNNAFSTKKIADVLWFGEDGGIRFGAPIFDTGEKEPLFRYTMEFKKDVSAGISFSQEYQKIIFDHLIPVDDQSEGMYFNYVPDGSYEGFEWVNGHWSYIDKVFHFTLKDGEFPDESYPKDVKSVNEALPTRP